MSCRSQRVVSALRALYRQAGKALQAARKGGIAGFGFNFLRFPGFLGAMTDAVLDIRGFKVFKGYLSPADQAALVADLRDVVARAPLFSPMTPYGKPMRVKMTSAGRYGWVSDRRGYRYSQTHPSGMAWPAIPTTCVAWRRI